MSDSIQSLFKGLAKAMEDDKNANLFGASDIRMPSHIPRGILTRQPMFDLTLGREGIPIGKIIEFFGFERSGKTTSAYHIIAQCQRGGGTALFIDTESGFDPVRAKECGCAVDGDSLQVVAAKTVDAVFRTIDSFLKVLKDNDFQNDVLIVVDSITAVESEMIQKEKETWKAVNQLGADARTIRSGIRHTWNKMADQKVTTIFINHAIANMATFGKQSQASGGHALKLAASLRVEFKNEGEFLEEKKGKDDADRERYGQKVKVTFEKLKGAKMRKMTYSTLLLNDGGFDSIGQLLEASMKIGLIKKMNNVTYSIVNRNNGEEVDSFTKPQWPDWVNSHGGFDEAYKWFLAHAKATGAILPWGVAEE